jgi:hypothetical protein
MLESLSPPAAALCPSFQASELIFSLLDSSE